MKALAIIIEDKPVGELEIELEKVKMGEDWISNAPTRFNKQKRKITKVNYTCPYCLTPHNHPNQAIACRDKCVIKLIALEDSGLRNRRFIYHGAHGRIVGAPDNYTFLVGIKTDSSKGMVGPCQLIQKHLFKNLE